MMEVLCSGYHTPFHSFPPMTQEPLEFPSHGLGSVKDQALQEVMDKMLEKAFRQRSRIWVGIVQPAVSCSKGVEDNVL